MTKFAGDFEHEYKKLNKGQKDAVESLAGPVMVVAGPGTGKTQVLALRIANILNKTDIKADGVLCLTFTNSAAAEMKKRLVRYLGETGEQVNVSTFHSFGMKIIGEYFKVLGLEEAPKLMEDTERAILFDQILNAEENKLDWVYLRPRGNSMRYFQDLKSLLSLLKRERISRDEFLAEVEKEIKFLENDESSISSRGESKGKLKKEIITKIEGLERTREVAKFIDLYEQAKKEKNILDYDDVLENLVKIVELSEEAADTIRERYLYVLVDEHQDSSRVQNEFLTRVWAEVERPDIFVVGDDRQLIYGFSGASIEYFAGFKNTFTDAKLITLTDNYRSTQVILDASHALLQSVMSKEKLVSQSKDKHPIKLIEANTPEEEIIAAALDIKEKIKKKDINPNDCAILVPKNRQVRRALEILHEYGIAVSTLEALNLFDQEETYALLRVLKIINTGDAVSLALSFFDKVSGIEPIEAHKFIVGQYMREFSFDKLLDKPATLFSDSPVDKWISKLVKWKKDAEDNQSLDLKSLIQKVGEELLQKNEQKLVSSKEILATIISLLDKQIENNSEINLAQFVSYLDKLESFGEYIPVLTTPEDGVKVLTMHGSKGREFDYVWIAHMDESSLSGSKKMGFALPESIGEKIEERDVDAIKRKLYVAITRAKRFCTLSYSTESHKGTEQELAKVIDTLPPEVFEKTTRNATHSDAGGDKAKKDLSKLTKLVGEKYKDRYVSASMLNNFFECPWKWYFQNILQLPSEKSESLEFGSAVHEAIDKILQSNKVLSEEEYEKEYQNKEVAKVVIRWAERRLKEIAPSRENEQSVSMSDPNFPGLKIYGKIDLIEKLDGKEVKEVRVTDFKTGSVRKKSEIEKLDEEGRMSGNLRQLAMYSYLLEQGARKLKVKESRLEFLEAKKEKESFYDTEITAEEIMLLMKDIEDYDKLAKSGGWATRECNYNSYGKNTECEYCKLAEVYTD